MHIGLLDRYWNGHHTVFAARRSQYFVDAGHEVTFITGRGHDRLDVFPDADSFAIEHVSPPPESDLSRSLVVTRDESFPGRFTIFTAAQLRSALVIAEQCGVDLLHVLHLNPREFPLWLATRSAIPFPIVTTVHRDHYELRLHPDVLNHWGLSRCLQDGTLSKVFVNVETQAQRIKDIFPDAHDGNVETIPLATPHPPENLSQTEARVRLDLPRDVPLLLFFASHRYEQGPDILLDAVTDFDTPVAVAFAGPPGHLTSEDLDAFEATDTGETRIVNRIGWVPEEDVYPYFVAADAVVMPFRRSRGVSESLNRACLTNTHPISSDDSDVGYLVDEYELGQTFTRGSVPALRAAIQTFLENRGDFPQPTIAEYGRSQLNERTGDRLENAYESVLSG